MKLRPVIIWPAKPSADPLILEAGELRALTAEDSGIFDLILPGQILAMHPHELPAMKERERLKAARFAIEDKVAAPIDSQHIVLSPAKSEPADQRLAVMDKAVLREILGQLSAQNISAEGIFADFDWAASNTPLRFTDRIIVPGRGGYTVDPQWADKSQAALALSDWSQIEGDAARALNLAQGEFTRRRSIGGTSLKGLGRIAAIFLAVCTAWLALQLAQARAITAQAENLRADAAALYTRTTGKPAPKNLALTVTRAVKSQPKSGADFMPLLASLNQVIGLTQGVTIDTISFDAKNAQLDLRLTYPEFDSAADMERAAHASGNRFRAGGVREQNGVLIGDGVFTLGGGS